jgi:hypothetical protein
MKQELKGMQTLCWKRKELDKRPGHRSGYTSMKGKTTIVRG